MGPPLYPPDFPPFPLKEEALTGGRQGFFHSSKERVGDGRETITAA
jgi:hypothetical protein